MPLEAQRGEAAASNAVEVTVSDLAQAMKRTLEDRFGYVRVRGEITGYRGPHSSGHVYFALKDAGARLDAVIWKMTFARMRIKPEEGLEVVATGKITTFANKSSYQIIVDAIEPAGAGALMALLEARRRQLAGEGLFDFARKRAPPYLPRVVGVVTSPTGAVIRDILHRLADRMPVRVVVWPVRVQGEGSAGEIARAILGFNALEADGPIARPDVLIVARGGGSIEDLWSFNDEAVVRAAAASAIPLISAVGHETDWTLIDHAADLRAPTPTAAAEISVPVRAELLAKLAELDARGRGAMLRLGQRRRSDLKAIARALPAGDALLAPPRQRLDAATAALAARARTGLDARALRISALSRALARHSPHAEFARAAERIRALAGRLERVGPLAAVRSREQLARTYATLVREARRERDRRGERLAALARGWSAQREAQSRALGERAAQSSRSAARLRRAFADAVHRRRAALTGAGQVFAAINYRSVLARGYALVRNEQGKPVRGVAEAQAAVRLAIEFADGTVEAALGAPTRPPKKRTRKAVNEQSSLF